MKSPAKDKSLIVGERRTYSHAYIIEGDPKALARHRTFNDRVWDSQKQLKLVLGMQIVNQHGDLPLFDGPLQLDVVFYMPMPKKASSTLANRYHFFRPDLDNLLKLLFDICNTITYKDDCIISKCNSVKRYAHIPRTEFTLTELGRSS